MRVLLDECLPRKLKREVQGHDVTTVPEMGWAGKKNGDLLRLAAPHFEAFVTMDQGIRFQQVTTQLTRLGSRGEPAKTPCRAASTGSPCLRRVEI